MKFTAEEISDMDADIKGWVEEACKDNPPSDPGDKVKIENALKAFLSGDMPVYKALEIPEKVMEQYYTLAYNLYKIGNYKDSLTVFQNLYRKDGMNPRYNFGIAACYHQLKDYENATLYYQIAAYLNPNDPIAGFHLYDCWMRLNNLTSAAFALQMVINRTENVPQYKALYDAATMNMTAVEQLLEQSKVKTN